MRRTARASLLSVSQSHPQVDIRQPKAEVADEHVAIFILALQRAPLHLAGSVPNVEARVEQSEPSPVRPRSGGDHVVQIRTLRMAAGEPVGDFVLGIDTRQ